MYTKLLFFLGHLARIYDPNLVIIQQRYKSLIRSWQRYYHALANKVELSKEKTAIVLVSSDMNDHDGGKNKKYVNPIVESANSFKPDIDSEEDIRNGDLYKMFVHLITFFVEKHADCVKVTYISSIDPNAPYLAPASLIKKILVKKINNFIKLKEIFKK
ncbi:hypothetical protein [Plasmodium yoelii yoelii]|uniref:Fam-a protein n=1 Tax=Plasmodium yoelii yoelii TaxID=73239 RepID=Q7R7F7_PLAYO|nr:hypothetical protein [Plasmodium yoelii yoelii]